MVPKISFRHVKKVYPSGTYALDDINFDIEQGDFVCIIGESGGGKTTLLKLISGLDRATSGEIYFDNEISNYLKVAQRDVAFVFQEYTIYPNMTVFENIVMALSKYKLTYEEKCVLAWDIIKKMNLEMIQGEVPKALSFGQCQKVALAKVLVRKPKIVLFDEPLSNIDVLAKNDYKKLIIEAKNILPDATFVYVTHSINDAMQLANKIMVIHNGEILQFDDKQMVYQYPNSQLVADYMLEGNQKYYGKIENDHFVSDNFLVQLNQLQKATLNRTNLAKITCYSLGKINTFFDEYGKAITGFNQEIVTEACINEDIFIFDQHFELGELKPAIIHKGIGKCILFSSLFSLKEFTGCIAFRCEASYIDENIICACLGDFSIPIFVDDNFQLNDNATIYYPLDKIKIIDKNNNLMLSSYVVSENIIKAKVINSKKGIALIGGKRMQHDIFINKAKEISISIPLDAFEFTDKGSFSCDDLFNEENLGSKKLIHFSCKMNSYLSAIVSYSFKGYNLKKIKFNIDYNKVLLVD